MSDDLNRAGMCAAFGCPLLGSLSSSTLGDGKWACFCHFGKQVGTNDAITARLNSDALRPIVNATIDIRRFAGTDEWEVVHKGIRGAFKRIGRNGLLSTKDDYSVRGWLLRLEAALIHATRDAGLQERLAMTPPPAPVVGPTHAASYHPYAGVEA